MKVCRYCGAENRDDAVVCDNCGVFIDSELTGTELLIDPDATSLGGAKKGSQDDEAVIRKQKKHSYKWLYILLLCLALAAAALGAGYWYYNSSKVEAPVYSVPGGRYSTPQYVEIEGPGDGYSIFYTTDGTDPDVTANQYFPGKPIELDKSTILKSVAVDKKGKLSDITQEEYTIDTGQNIVSADSTSTNKNESAKKTESKPAQNKTASKAPKKQESTIEDDFDGLKAQVIAEWPISGDFMSNNFTADASSTLPSDGETTFYASNAIDNDKRTMWVENKESVGTGEGITLKYTGSEPLEVNEILFLAGNANSDTDFALNSTPILIAVSTPDKETYYLGLQNTLEPQTVVLEEPITLKPGNRITLEIAEVAVGENDQNLGTAISEIGFQ